MNAYEINPYIRTAIRQTFGPREVFDYSDAIDHALTYIYNGEVIISCRRCECVAHEGDLLLLYPDESVSLTPGAGGAELGIIHFDPMYDLHSERNEHVRRASTKDGVKNLLLSDTKTPLIKVKDKFKIRTLLDTIFDTTKADSYIKKKSALLELIACLAEDNFKSLLQLKTSYPIEMQIKTIIDSGKCMAMGLDELAELFAYDKFYLEKKFRNSFGMSIISYRNKKRMECEHHLGVDSAVAAAAKSLQ